jgi:hypothetical protein
METTSTFRDYAFDSFSGGEFSIETLRSMAVLRLALNHPEFAEAYYFDHDTARQLGTNLLQWNGSPLTCTIEPVEFIDTAGDVLRVEVIDGDVMFLLCDGNLQAADEEVIDLAQRLIVWAGVDMNSTVQS